jgi:hypothetical protein
MHKDYTFQAKENTGMFTICPHTEHIMPVSNSTTAAVKTVHKFNFTQSYVI